MNADMYPTVIDFLSDGRITCDYQSERTYKRFIADVEGRQIIIAPRAAGRLYARTTTEDDFGNLWARQCGDIDYPEILAIRFYSVDNPADVAELVQSVEPKNGVPFTETMIENYGHRR
jgi:hypothetical protein